MLLQSTLFLLVAYILLCTVAFLLQRSMIYFPSQPAPAGARMTLQTDAGPVLVSTRTVEASPDALVYLGGNAEDVSATLPEFARALPRHSLYFLHYRGYGGSAGRPSEPALLSDALALFDRVRATHPNVAIVGRSLGGSIAVYVASRRPDAVSRLVLLTPFASLADVAAHHYSILPVRWLLKDCYESWRWAPQVNAKTLILAASADEVVPRECTEKLLQYLPSGRATLLRIEGATHNSLAACPDPVTDFVTLR